MMRQLHKMMLGVIVENGTLTVANGANANVSGITMPQENILVMLYTHLQVYIRIR